MNPETREGEYRNMYDRQSGGKLGMCIVGVTLALQASGAGAAFYSGGTGTESDPYQIGSTADWTMLSATPVDWDKHFFLVADIDFDGAALAPVGNLSTRFSGVLNGTGHVLSNGQINLAGADYVGVIGCQVHPG